MKELLGIQYLRAVAAIMVVLVHLEPQWRRMGYDGPWPHWLIGGVDIFFVISGFIMWVTTSSRSLSPGQFYLRRIVRIVPLYWLLSGVVVAVMLAAPQLLQTTRFDLKHVLASFAFVPMASPATGHMEPVLVPGWTLNYEMFFYLLFGAALQLPPSRRLAAMAAALMALVGLQALTPPPDSALSFYSSSIMLEFLLGMVLGQRYLRAESSTGWRAGALMAAAGLLLMALLPERLPSLPRLATMGLPAALIVAGTLRIEAGGRLPRVGTLRALGNASYSLYLSHPLVLSAASQAWRKVGLTSLPHSLWLFSAAAIIASVAGAAIVYRCAERPLTHALRPR